MSRLIQTISIIISAATILLTDTCNGDNCLNALSQRSSSAIAFCNTYTADAYPTPVKPTPTYIPSTCGPQRISSACYCVDNALHPAFTAPACPTSQVLANPSFYGQGGSSGLNVDVRPWVIAVPSGLPGCVPINGYATAYGNGPYGDPRALQCSFNSTVGGKSTVTQDIKLCASTKYTLTIHTACDFWTSSGAFGIKYRVLLGSTVILPSRLACTYCADPNNPDYDPSCRTNVVYEEAGADFTTSAAGGKYSLVIEVTQPAGLGVMQVPMLLDQIYIDPYGSTDRSDPALS